MYSKPLYILAEDKEAAQRRIAELEKAIQDLGPEFYDVFNQSSETWHDNAPFDALRDRQAGLSAELQNLKAIMRQAAVSIPKPNRTTVGIGARVTVKYTDLDKDFDYLIVGDWTYRAGKKVNGATIVSTKAPITQALFGRKIGETTHFKYAMVVTHIEYAPTA